jgi:hypothetical protein
MEYYCSHDKCYCWNHTDILIGNGEEKGMCLKELDDITNLLHQLTLLSSDTGISPTMDAHEFVHFEIDFDLNNPYQPIDEEIVQMLSSQHPIVDENEEVIIIDDVVEVHMGFKDALNALETLKKFLEQKLHAFY